MEPIIVARLAAAAAKGFEESAKRSPRGPTQWVAHCREAAEMAKLEILTNPPSSPAITGTLDLWIHEMEHGDGAAHPPPVELQGPELEELARAAASKAFRAAMPLMTSRGMTKVYIACVAAGTQDGIFTALESRSLLYSCQLALSAYKPKGR